MKIGYVTADWSDIEDPETGHPTFGGSGWYRCGLPSRELPKHGIETVAVELISVSKDGIWLHDWDKQVHKDCDVIVLQRWMHESAVSVIERAKAAGQVVINDVDDWYWGLDPRNHAYAASDPILHPTCNRDHYWKAIEASDVVTVSTPFLAEKFKNMPGRVELVRNSIDIDRFPVHEVNDDKPRFGWVGSTNHRSGDLETLRGILGPFCRTNNVKFVHAGHWNNSTPAGDLAGVDEELQEVYPIVSILEYPTLFDNMEVGIVPLNQIPFNHAKSCIKGMEYAAAGIPFIAERTPEYDWLQKEHGIGITCKKPREWLKALEKMLDPDFRRQEAERNLRKLEALDISEGFREWHAVYYDALKRKEPLLTV